MGLGSKGGTCYVPPLDEPFMFARSWSKAYGSPTGFAALRRVQRHESPAPKLSNLPFFVLLQLRTPD